MTIRPASGFRIATIQAKTYKTSECDEDTNARFSKVDVGICCTGYRLQTYAQKAVVTQETPSQSSPSRRSQPSDQNVTRNRPSAAAERLAQLPGREAIS